ncbi:unnamed protein product [Rhodiola kirilowii]
MKVRCSFIRCLFPPTRSTTRSTSSLQTRSAQSRVAVSIEDRNCMADVVATARSAPESSSNGRICGIAKRIGRQRRKEHLPRPRGKQKWLKCLKFAT